ncbi:MAG TPA: 6-bladed beta-propeller, partial [Gemmatimonadaceae bacterium]|nr:6-bladed beta-propeller [Gemmatimonadaceae bacterium]
MSRSRRAGALALALTALTALACGDASEAARRDVATWSVDSSATLTIGRDASDDAGVTFELITGATRLPDGRLLVADLGDAPLTLFDADGRLLRVVARSGQGPGEITYLARLFRCGGRLFTYDIDGRRISEFSLEGEYVGEFRFALPDGQQAPYASACGSTGRFLHLGWGARGVPTAGYHRDTVPVWITATPSGAPMVIDSVPASERWGQTHQGRIVGSRPLPLGKQPLAAVGSESFYVATGDAFEVLVYDSSGVSRGSYRLSDSVPAITAADVKDFVEEQVAAAGERARP